MKNQMFLFLLIFVFDSLIAEKVNENNQKCMI